ncbi:hypothetical protein C8R45DRAFT_1107289 [Mycena sanguinolenta]|nr:hypothetical protein C8R45DRAFT_1107289 [Mycena sanguinolenta]
MARIVLRAGAGPSALLVTPLFVSVLPQQHAPALAGAAIISPRDLCGALDTQAESEEVGWPSGGQFNANCTMHIAAKVDEAGEQEIGETKVESKTENASLARPSRPAAHPASQSTIPNARQARSTQVDSASASGD